MSKLRCRILIVFILFIYNSYAQKIQPDINFGEIQKDTVSIYNIVLIEDRVNEFIIHVVRDKFYFRIKSLKSNLTEDVSCELIKVNKEYQLDIRDFKNQNIRILYSTELGDMGEYTPYSNNAEFLYGYNPRSENQYSQVVNLKGLCFGM